MQSTPLYLASQEGHFELVKLLIESNAQVNECTPLHVAAGRGNTRIVKCLMKNGALIDEENENGETPLYFAFKNGKQDVINYLTEFKTKRAENEIPKENYSNKDPCIICFKPRNELYALVPCGHTSLCETCCIKVKLEPHSKCPSCRKAIKSYMKIFFQVPK